MVIEAMNVKHACIAIGATLLPALLSPSPARAQEHIIASDGRERAPDALLGMWKADPAKSTTANREEFRSFQYTAEGKVLVSFYLINAQGKQAWGNWTVQLDGTPGQEYFGRARSIVAGEVTLLKVDELTLTLVSMVNGKPIARGLYEIAADGATLTWTRTGIDGTVSKTVYKRWSA